jgi:hypothetical protein
MAIHAQELWKYQIWEGVKGMKLRQADEGRAE